MRPLGDVLILDLSRFASGPYGTQFLADAGARVIKVEMPGEGDPYRHEGPRLPGGGPVDGTYFMRFSRGKESVGIDLSKPGGRRVLAALVGRADVLVENFKPGGLERLGFGWDRLRELNPRLVYATVTGFGHADLLASPLSRWPAFAIVAEAAGGLMAAVGDESCAPHSISGAGDLLGGLHLAIGILAALHQRERTGTGQRVDVAMADAVAALAENAFFTYNATGRVPARGTPPNNAPFGAFAAADGYVAIGVIGAPIWRRFCAAIGRPDLLDDPDLATGAGRSAHIADRILPAIDGWLRERPKAEAAAHLAGLGIPAAPVLDAREVTESAHFRARRMIAEFEYPGHGVFRAVASPIKLGTDPTPPPGRPPRLGEHTDSVLAELADLDARAVAALRAEGAIG